MQVTDQELFKAMSNRTRTKPQEIYSKITTHIALLQDQIQFFNKTESRIPQWLKRETNKMGGQPKRHLLKMMTQPKYQNLLLDCDLAVLDKANLKNSKLLRRSSTKTGKDYKNSSFRSTSKSFNPSLGLRYSKNQNSTKISSKLHNKKQDLKSTFIKSSNLAQSKISPSFFQLKKEKSQKDLNISMTESVLLAVKESNQQNQIDKIKSSHSTPLSLRQQIAKKQKILQEQWQRTELYHNKIGSWMGTEAIQELNKSKYPNNRVNQVIQKIRRSRPVSQHQAVRNITSRTARIHSQHM